MNRNLAGERFSRAELIAMAIEIGAVTAEEVTRDMKTHVFEAMTKAHRHGMFMRGEAVLDTRPAPERTAVRPTVDTAMVAFLTKPDVADAALRRWTANPGTFDPRHSADGEVSF